MSLTIVEHLALWGPPILMLLLSGAYYLRWGKEADESGGAENSGTRTGGEH